MTDTSIFLARLIGPIMILVGLSILSNPARMQRIAEEFLASDTWLFVSGLLAAPTGLAIVLTHNIWSADWRVSITIFGWLAVLAGIARIMLPDQLKSIGAAMLERTTYLRIPAIFLVLYGAFLCWHGYGA